MSIWTVFPPPPKEEKVIGLEKRAELSRELDTLEENERLIDQQIKNLKERIQIVLSVLCELVHVFETAAKLEFLFVTFGHTIPFPYLPQAASWIQILELRQAEKWIYWIYFLSPCTLLLLLLLLLFQGSCWGGGGIKQLFVSLQPVDSLPKRRVKKRLMLKVSALLTARLQHCQKELQGSADKKSSHQSRLSSSFLQPPQKAPTVRAVGKSTRLQNADMLSFWLHRL